MKHSCWMGFWGRLGPGWSGLLLGALLAGGWLGNAAGAIVVDGAQTFQVIEGFGVNAGHRAWNNDEMKPVLDGLIDQGGMTLFRLLYDKTDWEASNDNSDPNVFNWTYYNSVYSSADFEKFWGMAGYLNQRGISNGLMFNFQGQGPRWMTDNSLTPGYENEWAEMIASLCVYARSNRHVQFGLVSPDNEPDNPALIQGINMTSSQYVTALHKLSQLLDTNGMSDLKFVGPDLANGSGGYAGTNWFGPMMADSLIMSKLAHFGVHSYGDAGSGTLGVTNFLYQSAYSNRTFWLTEFNVWCEPCESRVGGTNGWNYARGMASYLYYHLSNGASAGLIWEGFDSQFNYYCSDCWSYWGLYGVDNINAATKTYTPRRTFYAFSQFSRFIRPGARRLGLSGAPVPLLAFYHPVSGQVTLVGINSGSALTLSGTLTNLPATSTLELYYTSSATNLYHSGSFPVTNRSFALTIPADCVFTLTASNPASSTVSVLLTNPVAGAKFAAPATISLGASASTSSGQLGPVVFWAGTNQLGQVTNPPYSLAWSNVAPGAYTLKASATNSLGAWAVSPDVTVRVTGPATAVSIAPASVQLAPYTSQAFVATATDAQGVSLEPSPSFSWQVSGGGSINSTGLFSAGGLTGGPFLATASSGSLSGTASIFIWSNLNLALSGVGRSWYSLTNPTNDAPQAAAPGLNDANLSTEFPLLAGGGSDLSNAYEAAGLLWSNVQSLNRVVYYNGPYTSSSDGVFSANFKLQFSTNASRWSDADGSWSLSPAYAYNSAGAGRATYAFTGGVASVRGVRCVGQVHTTSSDSWYALATELEAYAAPQASPPLLSVGLQTNGVAIAWPRFYSNYFLESSTNLGSSAAWWPVTNSAQTSNELRQVIISPISRQFYRLHD